MKSRTKEQGSTTHIVIVIILLLAVLGLLGFVFWQNFVNKTDSSSNTDANSSKQASVDSKKTVSIHPQDASGDEFTAVLPNGWSVQKIYEDNDIVKTTNDGKRYLISSFIANANVTFMQNNNVSSGDVIKTVKTSKGTEISIVQTPELLVLTTCKPTGDNCYLSLNGKSLYVHLYLAAPGQQSAPKIDYSSDSAKEIIGDFEQIAASLNI